ncbi:hypothetical protein HK413_09310 [Mucilaginibacter sp. S1162]|uniref:Uncharacterized protein n=1 Tax=Mucilaginibacter humi TaxID=2732510 RepID=A0ABX1W7A5_9SPHI|nr:hypothetical protein [Mucilaginibacter humi]NNU34297.1 hypothetical protein [Mucilaginibacter humi]
MTISSDKLPPVGLAGLLAEPPPFTVSFTVTLAAASPSDFASAFLTAAAGFAAGLVVFAAGF